MIKLLDLLNEKKMTSGEKKEKEKLVKGMKKAKGDFKKRYGKDAEAVMYSTAAKRAMDEKLDPVGQEDADIDNDGDQDKTDKYLLKRRKAIAKNIKEENLPYPLAELYNLVEKLTAQGVTKDEILRIVNFATASSLNEGGDHEVAMAQSSLKDIAKAAIELSQKMGGVERNIPGWIQDHITNAENYIEQAAQGFHELKGEIDEAAKVRKEPIGGRMIELIISSKDKSEVEKEIDKIEREYPSAGYGTRIKKSPYQKGDTWIAVVSRSTTSD